MSIPSLRELFRMWALTALVFVVAAMGLAYRHGELRSRLVEQGDTVPARFLRWEEGEGARGACRYAVYAYTTTQGETLEGRHGCFTPRDAPPTHVTYLPNEPRVQLPDVVGGSRVMDTLLTGLMAMLGALSLLGFAAGARALVLWATRRPG
ncbi:MAG: DUF3592 domain-containing protein [Myxococcota bacterium]